MITSEIVSTPVTTNIQAVASKFKIKAGARAFKILSGFYSEPILAIPRELGANAWDSHVKAKNTDVPFEVHAPNNFEPWFSIRDFGTGMSPKDIDEIYTTYFESTKTQDNDSDGCMGLGSKTPLNYTDNFTVTSWFGGKKHVYSCFLDETRSPNLLHMSTEDSAEHTGMQIKFAVKKEDISSFVEKITRAYEPFRHRPRIVGATIVFSNPTYIYKGKTWRMRRQDGYSRQDCLAYMGNYAYPVNTSALIFTLNSADDGYALRRLLDRGGFEFDFNIGDLEVAPNKEQLQYDCDKTLNNIITAVRTALKEVVEMARAEISVPASRWEAMRLVVKHSSYNSPLRHVWDISGSGPKIMFDGKEVSSSISVVNVNRNSGVVLDKDSHLMTDEERKTYTEKVYKFSLYGMSPKIDSAIRTSVRVSRSNTYTAPAVETAKVIIFYTSSPSLKRSRLREYFKKNPKIDNTVYYILSDGTPSLEFVNGHKKYFGWTDDMMINVDTLPKPPVIRRVPTQSVEGTVHVACVDHLSTENPGRLYFSRKEIKFDPTVKYYYVDMFCSTVRWKDKPFDEYVLGLVCAYAKAHKLIDEKELVYGLNKKDAHYKKSGTWVNIVDLAKKYATSHRKDVEHDLYKIQAKADFEEFKYIADWMQTASGKKEIAAIESRDTIDFLKNVEKQYNITLKSKGPNYLDMYLAFGFATTDAKQDATEYVLTAKQINDELENRYIGLLKTLINGYAIPEKSVARFINLVNKK